MTSKRLHPIYRWLAGILGTASLAMSATVIVGGGALARKFDLAGGLFIGGLFLYCAITGNQFDYKPESRDE